MSQIADQNKNQIVITLARHRWHLEWRAKETNVWDLPCPCARCTEAYDQHAFNGMAADT